MRLFLNPVPLFPDIEFSGRDDGEPRVKSQRLAPTGLAAEMRDLPLRKWKVVRIFCERGWKLR